MILGPSLCTCVKTAPSPTGLASAITCVGTSLSKYPKVLALDRRFFSSSNASFCSFLNINGVPDFVRRLKGSEIVATTTCSCKMVGTRSRKRALCPEKRQKFPKKTAGFDCNPPSPFQSCFRYGLNVTRPFTQL